MPWHIFKILVSCWTYEYRKTFHLHIFSHLRPWKLDEECLLHFLKFTFYSVASVETTLGSPSGRVLLVWLPWERRNFDHYKAWKQKAIRVMSVGRLLPVSKMLKSTEWCMKSAKGFFLDNKPALTKQPFDEFSANEWTYGFNFLGNPRSFNN